MAVRFRIASAITICSALIERAADTLGGMLQLQPGVTLSNVHDALVEASRATTQAIGAQSSIDVFNEYGTWAANQIAALRHLIAPAELDRLVMTRRYWALLGASPVDFGPSLRRNVEDELNARKEAFDREAKNFAEDMQSWGNTYTLAVVPDTSVFVEYGYDFPAVNWHEILRERPHLPIYLVVTMAAVVELDGKKLSRDSSAHGKKVLGGVRGALRRIEQLFPTTDSRPTFTHKEIITSTVTTALLTDGLAHVPLVSADAEMIQRGLDLLPYSGRSMLVTYDVNQAFRARSAGLEATKLKYDYEKEPADGQPVSGK